MNATLKASAVRKSFGGVEVLHGVDLHAAAGSVLALVGENGAGKSTLVKILSGIYIPDGGTITVSGGTYDRMTPRQARDLGIAIISQEFQDAPALTVAENISLGNLPSRAGLVRWSEVRSRAVEILKVLKIDLDPSSLVSSLRVGERQIVEIARALSMDAKTLILDEPTAALSFYEAEVLFDFVRRLQSQGVAIIYITHRLDEVGRIADRVQVLRDGSTVLEAAVEVTSRSQMIEAMIGHKADTLRRPNQTTETSEAVLRWEHATIEGHFEDVSLEVRAGEVVAIFGKLGSGASEVAESAYGLRALDSGSVVVNDEPREFDSPLAAINAGVGFLPADRKEGGAFMVRSVAENIAVASWPRMARFGQFISEHTESAAYSRWHQRLSIRSRNDPRQLMWTLSGGNQQKVLLARWLERRSRALVLVEPTRGVDVGARREIYDTLRGLIEEHVGVLIITSDYEEAFQVADVVYVMAKGQIVGHLRGDEIDANHIVELAGG